MSPSRSDVPASPHDLASDHFDRLGLPRQFQLDRDALESSYLDLSRQVHPDRFVGGSTAEQREAMERSAALNGAYQVLRDPVRRAEYLLSLRGVDLDAHDGAPTMDQAFLMEMIERRERLESSRGDPDALDRYLGEIEEETGAAFDDGIACLEAGDTAGAARNFVARRYLQRLFDEVESARDES